MSWFIAALVVLAVAVGLLEVAHGRLVAKVEGLRYEVKCAQLAADTVNTRLHTVHHRMNQLERVMHKALERPAPWDEPPDWIGAPLACNPEFPGKVGPFTNITTAEPELAATPHRSALPLPRIGLHVERPSGGHRKNQKRHG